MRLDRGDEPPEHRFPDPQGSVEAPQPHADRDRAGQGIDRGRDSGDDGRAERVAPPGLAGRERHGVSIADLGGFCGRHVEHDVERRGVGDLDERLGRVDRGAQHGAHAGDDAGEWGAQGGELLGAPGCHGGHLRLRQLGGRLVRILLGQNPRLHEAHGAREVALRRRERGGGALRRGIERRPLELDQRVALGDPLARSDEDARHPCRCRCRELREAPWAGRHCADGAHDAGERLRGRDCRLRRDGGLGAGRLCIVGAGAIAAGGGDREQREQASHGSPAEAVTRRTTPAASFVAATSSM